MRNRLPALVLALMLPMIEPAAAASPPPGGPQDICERELARASKQYDVPLQILYAVGLTESGYKGSLHPYMLYIEGKDHVPTSRADALKLFHQARARGVKLIDIGCMQVNYYWHKDEFNALEDMFDPRLNVEQAARFLRELRQRHGSWTMAVARYNAGARNTVGQHRYVCRVMRNLVQAGVGTWTADARTFCDTPPEPPSDPAPASVRPAAATQPSLSLY